MRLLPIAVAVCSIVSLKADAWTCFDPVPWTQGAYRGGAGIWFADVNGDGRTDAIAQNFDYDGPGSKAETVGARYATPLFSGGVQFAATETTLGDALNLNFPNGNGYVVDVNADGFADFVYLDPTRIRVRINTGQLPVPDAQIWSTTGFAGANGTFMADVNNDHRADIIAVDGTGIQVRRSTGTSFAAPEVWSEGPRQIGPITAFADVTGDGRADAISVRSGGIWVQPSSRSQFLAATAWTSVGFSGDHGTYFADVTGDGRADAIAVSSTGVLVRRSTGTAFGPPEVWLSQWPFYGTFTTAFAPVSNPTRADMIIVPTNDGIQGRPSTGYEFHYEPGYCP